MILLQSLLTDFYIFLLCFINSINTNSTFSPRNGTNIEKQPRIIGGYKCSTDQYPFMVLLLKIIGSETERNCGGTLLSEKYVLTAGQCCNYPDQVAVVGIRSRAVTRMTQHDGYIKGRFINDICVMTLEAGELPSYIRPVPIPPGSLPTKFVETKCKQGLVMGWGALNARKGFVAAVDEFPDDADLQCANITIIETQECKTLYKMYEFNDDIMCTYEKDKDTCSKDMGGPLICNGYQLGIASWGVGCAWEDHPGVYTRVDQHLKFLEQFDIPKPKSLSRSNNRCSLIIFWFFLFTFVKSVLNIL